MLVLVLAACQGLAFPLPTLPPTVIVPSPNLLYSTGTPAPVLTPTPTYHLFPSPDLDFTPTRLPSTPSMTPPPVNTPTAEVILANMPDSLPVRIMPMGDSLTEGAYPGPAASYRGYLEIMLRNAGYNFDFVGTQWSQAHGGTDYDHEGHGGFTIGPDESDLMGWHSNLYDHVDMYLEKDPDVILLLVGINAMFPTENRPVKPADAPAKLETLVQRIRFLSPEVRIFVASLAPTGWFNGTEWPEYMAVCRMAETIGDADPQDAVYFVDLQGILEPLMDKSTDFYDGLHFTESGAQKVAQVWFDALVSSGVLNGKRED
jgi:lysophospholipase L1-like esterase